MISRLMLFVLPTAEVKAFVRADLAAMFAESHVGCREIYVVCRFPLFADLAAMFESRP